MRTKPYRTKPIVSKFGGRFSIAYKVLPNFSRTYKYYTRRYDRFFDKKYERENNRTYKKIYRVFNYTWGDRFRRKRYWRTLRTSIWSEK